MGEWEQRADSMEMKTPGLPTVRRKPATLQVISRVATSSTGTL